ncbi:MAG: hypothetical protein UHU22_10085 [Ruminococcus sp.]|nr:hypothetical protein [Ruminococcus sp.]MEE1263311.1 hypothetical protein [Ruminococcus sp.]
MTEIRVALLKLLQEGFLSAVLRDNQKFVAAVAVDIRVGERLRQNVRDKT